MAPWPWRPLLITRDIQDIVPIFYCSNYCYCEINKGGRGENILRNIVGDKGCLGGGMYVCM